MATISDEAFAYLLVENYWENWSKMDLQAYKDGGTYDETTFKKRKRTSNYGRFTKNSYGAKQYGGWTNEAYCITNHGNIRNQAKGRTRDVIAIREDLSEYL